MTSPQTVRVIGLTTFFLGVILLLLVFFQAKADLTHPLAGPPATMIPLLARQIGLLFIMGFAGSSMTGRGIQLYSAGRINSSTDDIVVTEKI